MEFKKGGTSSPMRGHLNIMMNIKSKLKSTINEYNFTHLGDVFTWGLSCAISGSSLTFCIYFAII